MTDFCSKPYKDGDYVFRLERDRHGKTQAFRHLLSGDKPDPLQREEPIEKTELPQKLVIPYEILLAGGIPVIT